MLSSLYFSLSLSFPSSLSPLRLHVYVGLKRRLLEFGAVDLPAPL